MEPDRPLETPRTPDPSSPLRRRFGLLAALLGATLAVGAAAQHRAAPPPTPPEGPLAFRADASGPVDFSGQLDRTSVLAGGDGIVKLELVMRGEERPGERALRVPTDLVVILDRSGSMDGVPLHHAKAAVRELIDQLAPGDRFSLVSYASDARLEWPLEGADGAARRRWIPRLAAVPANGGTNMAAGMDVAAHLLASTQRAGRAGRVVLLSDGHANQGDHSLEGLRRRAARAVQGEYVFSAAGVGGGFDEVLMSALADAGTGNFYYVQHTGDLAGVFGDEFASARETIASSLAVAIRPGDGVEVVDAAGYPLERSGDEVRFRPGDLFAGQERRVWVTLRAPTNGEREIALGRFALSYRSDGRHREHRFDAEPRVTCVASEQDYYAAMDSDSWARSVIVDEVNALKQKVSHAVQAGERDQAVRDLADFVSAKKRENQVLQRDDVDEALRGLVSLEAEVEEAFAAEPSAAPALQNGLGKRLRSEGTDGRRVGAKR